LSDNGGPTRELTSSNAPFSGGKGTLLEGGIRIPFIIQWKSRLPCGRSYAYPISSLDIVPTVLSAAEVDFDADFRYASKSGKDIPHLDGIDLLPFLEGTNHQVPHDRLFWRYGQSCAVRSGDWKLIKQGKDAPFRLYNLARDIGETTDISNIQPERFDALKHMLSDWLKVLPPAITIDP